MFPYFYYFYYFSLLFPTISHFLSHRVFPLTWSIVHPLWAFNIYIPFIINIASHNHHQRSSRDLSYPWWIGVYTLTLLLPRHLPQTVAWRGPRIAQLKNSLHCGFCFCHPTFLSQSLELFWVHHLACGISIISPQSEIDWEKFSIHQCGLHQQAVSRCYYYYSYPSTSRVYRTTMKEIFLVQCFSLFSTIARYGGKFARS